MDLIKRIDEIFATAEPMMGDLHKEYEAVIKALHDVDKIETIVLARDTTPNLTDADILDHISKVIFDWLTLNCVV